MKILFPIITISAITMLSPASSWEEPTWEQMIRSSDVIGLFEITEGGNDEATAVPLRTLKGEINEQIRIQDFNNHCASYEWQEERSLKQNQIVYLFLYSTKGVYRTPTPSSGIYHLNNDHTVNYFLLGPTYFNNLPAHPKEEFEDFVSTTVYFQTTKIPDNNQINKLKKSIQIELSEINTNSLPDHLVYYRLGGGRDWIDGFEQLAPK